MKYKTSKAALLIDKIATFLVSVVGIGIIFTVLGMMGFLFNTVVPLAENEYFAKPQFLQKQGRYTSFFKDPISEASFTVESVGGKCFLKEFTPDLKSVLSRRPLSFPREVPERATVSCHSMGSSRILFLVKVDGMSKLHMAELSYGREFLSGSEQQKLSPSVIQELQDKTYSVVGSRIYAQTSRVAPVSFLKPKVSFLYYLTLGEKLADKLIAEHKGSTWLHAVKGDTGFVSIQKPGDEVSYAWVLDITENMITETKEIELTPISIAQVKKNIGGQKLLHLEYLDSQLWAYSDDAKVAVFPPNAGQDTVKSFSFKGNTQLYGAVRSFGYDVVFWDNGEGQCGVFDAGRFSRQGLRTVTQPVIPSSYILWTQNCMPARTDVTYAVHPLDRFLVRIVDKKALEAYETSTGRKAFGYDLQEYLGRGPSRLESASFSSTGHELLLNFPDQLVVSSLHAPHLEASFQSFFMPIQYEGLSEPAFTWQSSSGSDDSQAKLSMIPLIWGTLKACLYSMLFAVPLGIFSAVYSSEFLDRRTRNYIKPAIEMMASIPSVVLGFLAAIIIAPLIETNVVSVLVVGLFMPFLLYLFGSFLSSYSASQISARGLYASKRFLFLLTGAALLAFFLLLRVGWVLEGTAFGGDIKNFLSNSSHFGGLVDSNHPEGEKMRGVGAEPVLWSILLSPLAIGALWMIPVSHRLKKVYLPFVFLLGPVLALIIGILISSSNLQLQENIFGTYAQRNTLVIAVAVGFTIIPIIYSIAEDALTAVPNSLRAASLACGASVWQTTARVVLPTAASGIFSALVVGLGRGIGETMIVVMAAGNTAVMSVNPFDGLRSLAANIAIELPEAPLGGTHYRVLFFSALLLFAFTFVLNTCAEFMRMKYRKKNKAL